MPADCIGVGRCPADIESARCINSTQAKYQLAAERFFKFVRGGNTCETPSNIVLIVASSAAPKPQTTFTSSSSSHRSNWLVGAPACSPDSAALVSPACLAAALSLMASAMAA